MSQDKEAIVAGKQDESQHDSHTQAPDSTHSNTHHHEEDCCHHDHEHHHDECDCGCHDHHHHHHDGETCGCALCQLQNLTHIEDEDDEDDCDCCHDHHHEEDCCHHDHEHHHEECDCGCHDHHHHHDGETCGCALCQLQNLTHIEDEEDEDDCGCCHDHHHHEEDCCHHDHEHHHEECDCGCHDHHHHHHDGETCGCALCQLQNMSHVEDEEHDHEHESCHHHHDGESCGCAVCQMDASRIVREQSEGDRPSKIKKEISDTAKNLMILFLVTVIVVGACKLVAMPKFVEGILYLGAGLLWGGTLFKRGFNSIRHGQLDENTLMTIAVAAAFILGEFSEALMVIILFHLGEMLEEKAVQKSRKDIAQVVNIRPQKANRITAQGEIERVPSKALRIGDKIQIKAGERVPVDAVVINGESSMDRSAITGESAAVGVEAGDRLMSGEVNLSGVLTCRCESTFENSTASRIIQMVEESTAKKGHTEKFITRFAKYYTPAVVVMALVTSFVPPILGYGTVAEWVSRALVFLVASCPCALVISVPLAFFSGVGAISKQGVLVKGTKFLEPLSKATAVVFDKTGTITTGELTVSDSVQTTDEYDFKNITSMAESFSTHPIAKAVCKGFGKSTIPAEAVSDVKEIAGKGVSLVWEGHQILCGSSRMMDENNIDIQNVPAANVYTAVDGKLIGCVMMSDVPRKDAADTLKALKSLGVKRNIMLTGDSNISANTVKDQVGVDEMHCDLLPQDKAKLLAKFKNEGNVTVFVGDGINDAPVIAAADVGFAMGFGTDAAIESADAVLMADRLSALPKAMKTARHTVHIVKLNVAFILLSKILVMVLGVMGIAPMWLAVFADVGVSVLTILTSVSILKVSENDM